MKIITAIKDMQRAADALRRDGKRLAFVPTMGSLHKGHLQLLRAARARADFVIVSVYVNPTQFGPGEDFERYPRDVARDSQLAEQTGCDILFVPETADMYPAGFSTRVTIAGVSEQLEGASRPGHFDGVTTIVAKLFNIVKPHIAVFGQKDAQQAILIRKMARELNFDMDILVEATVREHDGVAMSSRNAYLSDTERHNATALSRGLMKAEQLFAQGVREPDTLRAAVESVLRDGDTLCIEYVAVVDAETLEKPDPDSRQPFLVAVAARLGSTRLIDNIILKDAALP